jgi:putative adhesin
MRASILVLASVSAVASLAAQGRPDFEFRRELATGKRLHVQNIIGDVQVTGGSGRTVEISAVKKAGRHGEPEDVTVETIELGDGVALCVRYPGQGRRRVDRGSGERGNGEREKNPCSTSSNWNGNQDRNDTEVNFTIRVPAGLLLRIGTVSGDLAAADLDGQLELSSVSGDVQLDGGRGPRIELETVSGDVELLDVRAREVSGNTVSGNVTFRGPVLDSGAYDFSTTSGDISLGLPDRPNATLSAATFSGRFSSDLATTQPSGRRRHRYSATWGSGSARLDVESLSGNIRITTSSR